ncbi:MAG: HNH endonuclease signature motif containing protein [Candidatus Heimdallarchaeota archaeon]
MGISEGERQMIEMRLEKGFLKYCLLGWGHWDSPFKGVKGVGKKKARKILSVYSSVGEVLDSGLSGLTQIKGIEHELGERIIKQLRKMEITKLGYESYDHFAYETYRLGRIRNFTATAEEQKQLIKIHIGHKARNVIGAIKDSMEEWPKEYESKGKIEIENARNIRKRLLERLTNLNKSELEDVVTIASSRDLGWVGKAGYTEEGKEVIASLKKRGDKELLELTWGSPFNGCYSRYYQWRRYGTIWKKKRKKILRQRRKCGVCKSTEKLEVHHLKGLCSENPEDLEVLCRKCHMKLTHWHTKKQTG